MNLPITLNDLLFSIKDENSASDYSLINNDIQFFLSLNEFNNINICSPLLIGKGL